MPVYVALLRAINVGSVNRLSMADLRALVTGLGHTDVQTYLQTGNVVFTSPGVDRVRLAEELAAALADRHGLQVPVVIRTPAELATALAAHPFTADQPDGARLAISFMAGPAPPEAVATLEPERFLPDRFAVAGADIYLHYPNGMARTRMSADYFARRLGMAATARNLNTVARLIDATGGTR